MPPNRRGEPLCSARVYWLLIILMLAASYGLSASATPKTGGSAFHTILISAIVIGGCWRFVERLLWMRFPTKTVHTTAARGTAIAVAVLLGAHAVLWLLGR